MKTTYRGVMEFLETSEGLRREFEKASLWLALEVGSYMSGLKRTTGFTLNARKPTRMLKEAAFKLIARACSRW